MLHLAAVVLLVAAPQGGRVAVHTQHADGGTAVLTPDLVIGADGINSAVRKVRHACPLAPPPLPPSSPISCCCGR